MLLALVPLCATAQVDDAIEQWMQEDVPEEQAAAAVDMLMQLNYEPVSINDTAAVRELPLMTPFRYRALCNNITLYGQLLSTKELALIPGFDSVTVALLSSMTTAEPYNGRTKLRWWQGHHNVVTGIGGTVEQAAGYRDGRYDGDNLHALFCYNYKYRNNISVRLVADKDPGEAWGKSNFYGYHVMLSNIGHLDKLIVGRYGLQFGQGLTLWTGFKPFSIMGGTPERFGTGVRQASTFYETDYLEGAAATVRLWQGLHLSAFASRVQGETLAGGHAEWRSGNLVAGVTVAATRLDDSLAVRDYVYNQTRFRGQRLFNGGVDATWQWRRLTLYGEASLDGEGHPAAIAGATLTPSSVNRFGVSYRYYHPLYHNLHAQGYAIGTTQGEKGVTLDAATQLPWGFTMLASVDLHHFESLRYGSYSPSSGAWLRLQVSRHIGQRMQATVRYADRLKERNIPNIDSTLYLGEQTLRRQLQGELRTKLGLWLLTTRAMYAHFGSENVDAQEGWLVAQTARYAKGPLQVTAGLAYFDVGGYYARLYLSESCLQYAWSIPMFYGKGLRSHVVVRWSINENISLAAKYGVMRYLDRDSVGSGAAETEGPARQTWFVQLRLKM
ncbi:MAG: hypothetical protein K6F72_06100 [Bacteroidales bacterium]|nr:hypothetical protein [Bacteroidales bacterium]